MIIDEDNWPYMNIFLSRIYAVWSKPYTLQLQNLFTLCPLSNVLLRYTVHDLETFKIFTVKPVLRGHAKKDKTKVLKTNGSSMHVESLAVGLEN